MEGLENGLSINFFVHFSLNLLYLYYILTSLYSILCILLEIAQYFRQYVEGLDVENHVVYIFVSLPPQSSSLLGCLSVF